MGCRKKLQETHGFPSGPGKNMEEKPSEISQAPGSVAAVASLDTSVQDVHDTINDHGNKM